MIVFFVENRNKTLMKKSEIVVNYRNNSYNKEKKMENKMIRLMPTTSKQPPVKEDTVRET